MREQEKYRLVNMTHATKSADTLAVHDRPEKLLPSNTTQQLLKEHLTRLAGLTAYQQKLIADAKEI